MSTSSTDNEKLQEFLEDLIKYDHHGAKFGEFSLEDLKELRWLVQMSIIEALLKQSKGVFAPVFEVQIDKENM